MSQGSALVRAQERETVMPGQLARDFAEAIDQERWLLLVAAIPSEAAAEVEECLAAADLEIRPVDGGSTGARALLWPRLEPRVVVFTGPEHWSKHDLLLFEVARERIRATTPRLIMVLSPDRGDELARQCPNFFSYLQIDTLRWSDGTLPPADIEARLRDLREALGKTDETVIAAAEAGLLPSDALHEHWLILLGRSDLLFAGDSSEGA